MKYNADVIDRCRICGSKGLNEFIHFDELPLAGLYLKKEYLGTETNLPLTVVICEKCGLIQLRETVSADIYSEYSYAGTFSQTYTKHLNWVANYLIKKGIQSKKVVEVGCSDGYLLSLLKEKGDNNVFGYEPSIKLAKECKVRNVDVSTSYFTVNSLKESKFDLVDCIVIRHVLEHINNFEVIFNAIREILKKEGRLIIEVPDVNAIFKKRTYSNFFHEHLNYFSLGTISKLLKNYDFYINNIHKVDVHNGSLFLNCSYAPSEGIDNLINAEDNINFNQCLDFSDDLGKYFNKIKKVISSEHKKGKRIGGYGASHRTLSILGMSGLSSHEIYRLYDKNKFLHNRFTPQSHIEIVSPSNLSIDKPDILIIFALSFEDEIVAELNHLRKNVTKFLSIKNTPHYLC